MDALTRTGGLLMHAAAFAGPTGGVLVVGVSGAGKTTLSVAYAARGGRVLSDENVVVRPTAFGWVIDGTPWHGDGNFAGRATVPLRGVMLLEQANEDRLAPISPARAIARLFQCHFPPQWVPDADQKTLNTLERLVAEVPCHLLRNRRGGDSPAMLLDLLS